MGSGEFVYEELPPEVDRELLKDFASQVREYVQAAEEGLLALEERPEEVDAVEKCLRALHTIKGIAGCLGLASISELAHGLESFLEPVKSRDARCTPWHASKALSALDMLQTLISGVDGAATGKPLPRPADYPEVLESLSRSKHGSGDRKTLSTAPLQAEGATVLVEPQAEVNAGPAGKASRKSTESYMRVRTERLDRLVDMVGELVIAQSMVSQDEAVAAGGPSDLLRKVTRASKIVRELQELSLVLRMLPLRNTFQTLARLVRDLAHRGGKAVQFVMDGEDTEIDRSMVDLIDVPLVHMARNAVDHGMESPDEREREHKPRLGTVRLRAFHSGGNVVIELSDDGRGLNRDRILKKAQDAGLVSPDRQLTNEEIDRLIFAPGLSTAERVTEISGRGIGMDVVRRNVEALRGRVEIQSTPGQGCTFRLWIPLTLAVTDGMLIRVGSERYILPTADIHMTFRPSAEEVSTFAGKGEMVLLRGELVPVVRLQRLLGAQPSERPVHESLLVVVRDGGRLCAFLVDELLGQHQVVAKSLGEGIGRIPGVSGGAILGDGRVGLILDPKEVAASTREDGSGEPRPRSLEVCWT